MNTVSDEVVLALDAYLWKEHGVCLGKTAMRAALEAVAPLLRAPAVQGGRVYDERLHSDSAEDVAQWLYANGHYDAAATVRGQLDVRNVRIRALEAALAQNAQGDEVARLKAVIERDRTAFCGLIARLKGELKSRAWLGDENARAAGGYTYDEPGFIREFGDACTAIMGALERAHRTFQDFTDCPSGEAIRNAQADAQAILDRHAERARVPDAALPFTDAVINKMQDVMAVHGFVVPVRVISDAFNATLLAAAPSQPEDASHE